MEEGLLKKTGKPLQHWVDVVHRSKLDKHGAILAFLKAEHGFTHGYANFVSMKARSADAASHNADDLLVAQYRGKESLKTIYDALHSAMTGFGDDITITPKKSTVSFIRKHQFALVKPATKTRIDLGLKIKGKEPTGRLESSGPFGAMCTHRVKLSSVDDVDGDVLAWLREAYDTST